MFSALRCEQQWSGQGAMPCDGCGVVGRALLPRGRAIIEKRVDEVKTRTCVWAARSPASIARNRTVANAVSIREWNGRKSATAPTRS
jgi:hypothetical protein